MTDLVQNQKFTSFIDGQQLAPVGSQVALVDPSNGKEWGTVYCDDSAIDAAVSAARAAFNNEAWAGATPYDRSAKLRRLGDLIMKNADELAEFESLANGKSLLATTAEIKAGAQWYYFYASALETQQDTRRVVSATADAVVTREPLGVVVAITPFNGAFSLGSWKLAPALAMGNAVILKPPMEAPVSSIRLAELAQAAGFPCGLVGAVMADRDRSEQLATHVGVDMVSFTGSTAVARTLGAKVTGELKRFACEAGGKSAHIVFADGDLDKAAVAATHGAFSGTGQTCVAGSRLLVQSDVYDSFVQKYLASVRRIRLGAPRSADSHLGPVASKAQHERVLSYINEARDAGATILAGGGVPNLGPDLANGFWVEPTVITDVGSDMRICREEIFGPVVTIQTFDTEEEAIALANGLEYGLAAGFWSNDMNRVRRVSRRLEAGSVWVNTYRAINMRVPFGGYKQSGLGRENGLEALEEFSQIKAIVQEYGPAADPFAT